MWIKNIMITNSTNISYFKEVTGFGKKIMKIKKWIAHNNNYI